MRIRIALTDEQLIEILESVGMTNINVSSTGLVSGDVEVSFKQRIVDTLGFHNGGFTSVRSIKSEGFAS